MTIEPESNPKNYQQPLSAASGNAPYVRPDFAQAPNIINVHLDIPEDHPKYDYYKKVIDVISLIENEKFIEAADIVTAIFRENPESSEGYFLFGLISLELDDQGRAIKLIEQAHERAPECLEFADALAVIKTSTGDLSGGLYFAKLATTLSPHPYIRPLLPEKLRNYFTALDSARPSNHYLTANIEFSRRSFRLAIDECEKELLINPDHASCLNLYGRSLAALAKYDVAASANLEALKLEPENSEFALHVGKSLCKLGIYDEGLNYFQKALASNNTSLDIAAEIAEMAHYLPSKYNEEIRKICEGLIETIIEQPTFERINIKTPKDPKIIHVGYLSNALFSGELSHFLLPIVEHHDQTLFRIHVYQQSETHDSIRLTVAGDVETVRQTNEIDDETLSVIICNDEIDVLVDLCGFSSNQRFSLLNSRPAKVQVGYLQPPYGMELPGINFVLGDSVTMGIDKTVDLDSQTVVNVSHGLFALAPLEQHPDVSPSPAEKDGFITFGGTCDLLFLNAEVVNAWTKVLKGLPNSKLLLGNVLTIPDVVKSRVIELFDGHGVADRIAFYESDEDLRPNPQYYSAVDIVLDTFPVSGTFSTCEALWMGVPVLTLTGDQRASVMGASILTTAGKSDWINSTEEQFVAGAIFLGKNISELARIRETLRGDMKNSPLFDPKSLTKSLEDAYCQALETVG
jgi:predicted O-linked N-acetylglucosamine transferase (SPINDLY family)